MESLSDVLEGIYEASSKWYNLGLRLGLLASVLDAISTRCLQDPEVCLREMLKEWLKRNPQTTTWKVLIRALESTAVGELVLAKHLKTKHCQQDPDQGQNIALKKQVGKAFGGNHISFYPFPLKH